MLKHGRRSAYLRANAGKSQILNSTCPGALIPPLSAEERAQLEDNIKRDGCRDPLVVWGATLLDGHNRFEICRRMDIDFTVKALKFLTRDDAADWIDTNQLGRRNLTPDQASLLRGRRYNRQKRDHGGDRRSDSSGQNVHSVGTKGTAERLAHQHGVNERTIRRDGEFAGAVEDLKPFVPDMLGVDVPCF